MKSQANDVLIVLEGLLKDARLAFPAVKGFDRDYKRLSHSCRHRGLGALALDLPKVVDLLLAGLELGRLPQVNQPFGWVSKRCRVPRLFAGLWLRIFDKQSCLLPSADINAIMFLYQLGSIAKKVAHECSDLRKALAMKGYINVESHLRSPSLNWQGSSLCEEGYNSSSINLVEAAELDLPLFGSDIQNQGRARYLLAKCQQVADLLASSMLPFDPVIWSDLLMEYEGITGLKHGTGAVAKKVHRDGKSRFASWPLKLNTIFPYWKFGGCLNDDHIPDTMESPSVLHMVPKTMKGPRLIAAEPVEHQWCQQLILNFLVFEFSRLFDGAFIDLRAQHKSARMVLSASRDKSLATVDLSDASDRLSCFVVERILRKNIPLLRALHAVRTRYVHLGKVGHGEFLQFKKFASQGTGTTFPVQSFVFLCCAITVSIGDRISWSSINRLKRTVRVYGDDIIIPSTGYADLRLLLTTLGLKVNESKSFANGHFRESCGTDAYKGYNITPVKPQVFSPDEPSSVIALVDGASNLHKKGFWHASAALLSRVPNYALRRIRIVGPDSPGIFGAFSFNGSSELHLRRRWNADLQRREANVFVYSTRRSQSQRDGYARLVDFSTMAHNPSSARNVSKSLAIRYAKGGVRWEPSLTVD